jgi:hypothetical protein
MQVGTGERSVKSVGRATVSAGSFPPHLGVRVHVFLVLLLLHPGLHGWPSGWPWRLGGSWQQFGLGRKEHATYFL